MCADLPSTEPIFHEIAVRSWADLQRLLTGGLGFGWFFRGMRDSRLSLQTSLERYAPPGKIAKAERAVIEAFRARAHQYTNDTKAIDNIVECLAMMQHHGAPTRLLDWTRSPYVAAFFAVEDATELGASSAVWAIRETWCHRIGQEALMNGMGVNEEAASFMAFGVPRVPEAFEEMMKSWGSEVTGILKVEPTRHTERLALQQGLFLCHINLDKSFEENLAAARLEARSNVKKFVISNDLRSEILTALGLMTITRASLFPGLDGFATSLKQEIAEDHSGTLKSGIADALLYHSERERIFPEHKDGS